jgi:hypothetical protein
VIPPELKYSNIPWVYDARDRVRSGVFGGRPTPSNLWLRPESQFDEARSLCQSRHPAKAATITTAAPGATNDAIIIATIATKASVIEVCRSSPGTLPGGLSWIGFQETTGS